MGRLVICDLCKKETTEVAHKVLLAPVPRKGRSMHSDYTHHADIGICCAGRVKQIIRFKPRRTRDEYNAARRKRAGMGKEVEKV